MTDLSTKYMGIELKNPVIAGASNMVTNLDNIKLAEESGAAAIIYKSLFEEQIQLESAQLEDDLEEYNERHAEMIKLFPSLEHAGPEEHLLNVRKTKENISIPLIASLNAIYKESWVEYATQLEETGIDGLELNFYAVPRDFQTDESTIISQQVEVFKAVKEKVTIPVSVKLSPFYTNPLNVIKLLEEAGVGAFVIFNRLFQPDIDIEKESHFTPWDLTNPDTHKLSLRFAGLLHGSVNATICSNSGIYTGHDVVKMILAGADCVQVVSTLYKNKIPYLKTIIEDIENWMNKKGYNNLEEFRGKLSNSKINDPFIYKRAQYIDLLLKSEDIFSKHKLR